MHPLPQPLLPAFTGRVLFLCTDAQRVTAQLSGAVFTPAQAGALRDDISTDEISPLPAMVHFDARLGRHAHTGYTADGQRPIALGALQAAGVQVLVGGARYGKGSSREHSPLAELSAGVQLVVAHSFERIYRQNADNLGLWTSTDLSLVPRIQRGEVLAVEELLAGRDALAASILRAGGLLRYGLQRPCRDGQPLPAATGPMTLFEKIVHRHALTPLAVGQGGFVRADLRFIHEYYTGMCAHPLDQAFDAAADGPPVLHEPQCIICFEDHLSYVHQSPVHLAQGLVGGVQRLSKAHRAFVQRFGLRNHGYLQALEAGDPGNSGSEGISHALVAEQYALPGQLLVGTDSHTPHSGALGCVACGVGSTDMALAFVTGAARLAMPEVVRVELEGALPAGVSAKDVALHLLALPVLRGGAGVGRVFEFGGSALRAMGTDERATLTNMAAEMGGTTGIVEPDGETLRFLRQQRGVDFTLQPWMHSDLNAAYALRITVDCSALQPLVARPGDPGNSVPLSELQQAVPIDIAYGGSCTAGKREDFDAYHQVLAWAAAHGLRVAPRVQFYLQFGTQAVGDYCAASGYLPAFAAVGATVLQPAAPALIAGRVSARSPAR